MAIKTQGTFLYVLAEKDNEETLMQIGCPTSISLGEVSVDTIETTCLSSTTRSYETGLETPGEGSIGINLNPKDESHMWLYEIQDDKTKNTVWVILGMSESTDSPELVEDKVELPDTRSWLVAKANIQGFSFNIEANSIVQVDIPIQRSGVIGFKPKESDTFIGKRFNQEQKGKFI